VIAAGAAKPMPGRATKRSAEQQAASASTGPQPVFGSPPSAEATAEPTVDASVEGETATNAD